ncbi:MAG: hypothetical protein QY326_01725 [Bdellovibrionota bacterium]|nr:MAG: hypothetical protein QY326_01725 [Bdellovibrionota bacterium]
MAGCKPQLCLWVQRSIALLVLFLFGLLWPLDLLCKFDLAWNGRPTQAQVIDSWEIQAKNGDVIHRYRVRFLHEERAHEATIEAQGLAVGETLTITHSPLWPSFAHPGSELASPPEPVTVFARLVIGAIFCAIAILVLLQLAKSTHCKI